MDAVSQIEPLLRARGQNLEINLDGHGSAVVSADRTRVLQVLVNLLKNASKYSPLNQAITLSVCGDSGQFFFGVTDRGPGITLEDQAHLFERFFRGKRAEEEGAGVGLGLALAKGIVEAHGGHIGVSSTIGSGSTFWFSLPEAGTLEV
jgi:signal transduction histidine kinase